MENKVLSYYYTADNEKDLPLSVENPNAVRYVDSHLTKKAIRRDDNKLERVDVTEYCALFVEPETLPMIEREYLVNKDKLATLRTPLRPTRILTRGECNTTEGRLALCSWENVLPVNRNGKVINDCNDLFANPYGETIWGDRMAIASEHGNLFTIPESLDELYSGLWQDGSLMGTPPFRDFHVDMALIYDTGKVPENREQFEQLALATYPAEHIDALLIKYDAIQKSIDNLWATYELFRTERYESIANCSPVAQQVAIRNYLFTFRTYGRKSKTKNPNPILTYSKPKYVVTNIAKALGIPDEVMTAVKLPMRFDFDKVKEPAEPKIENTGEQRKVGRVGVQERLQRTDYGRQLNIFAPILDSYIKEWHDGKQQLTKTDVLDMISNDTRDKKLQNEILYEITSRRDFDVEEITRRVAEIQTKEDYLACAKEMFFYIDATEIVKNLYGEEKARRGKKGDKENTELQVVEDTNAVQESKQSADAFVEFERRFRGMRAEAFLFDIQSEEQETKKRGRKAKPQQLAVVAPRFTWNGWVGEERNGKRGLWCLIGINPIFFANIANRYDELTPEYMKYNRAVRNNDTVTPAVEKVLRRVYEQRFPVADIAVRKALADVKKGGDRLNKEQIRGIRNDKFNIELTKTGFQDAIISNAGIPTPSKAYEWSRLRTKIERAMGLMAEHGVLIDGYTSATNDDCEQVWKINFKVPKYAK